MRPELVLRGVVPANMLAFDSELEIDEENLRTHAHIEVVNQRGEVCTVAQHFLTFLA
jgi:hypothetical protein